MTVRSVMLALACAFALIGTATAETRLDIGASWVTSRDLGYAASYPGARVEVEHEHGRFVLRGRIAAYDSAKLETGDGHGERIELLAGWNLGRGVSILAGPAYRQQTTSTWQKVGTPAMVEIRLSDPRAELAVGAEYLDDSDDTQTVLSTEIRGHLRRVTGLLRYEHVEYRTLFAEGSGSRIEVGLLYRLIDTGGSR